MHTARLHSRSLLDTTHGSEYYAVQWVAAGYCDHEHGLDEHAVLIPYCTGAPNGDPGYLSIIENLWSLRSLKVTFEAFREVF